MADIYKLEPKHNRAHSFTTWDCGDPNCGIHIVALDAKGNVMVEIVTSPRQSLQIIEVTQDILFGKLHD